MSSERFQPLTRAERVDPQTLSNISDFLFYEAELLDLNLFADWLKLVDPRMHYVIPTRVTLSNSGAAELTDSSHIDDHYSALSARVNRMLHRLNWAENPPSRGRHHVSNIRATPNVTDYDGRKSFRVRSNLFFYRSRLDESNGDLLSCTRQDVLVVAEGDFRLIERYVILDHTVVNTHNLAFLL